MSRGLGRTQRNILAYLDAHGASYFADVVAANDPRGITRLATYESYRRAMWSLQKAGFIEVEQNYGHGRPPWKLRAGRISVGTNRAAPCNHCGKPATWRLIFTNGDLLLCSAHKGVVVRDSRATSEATGDDYEVPAERIAP